MIFAAEAGASGATAKTCRRSHLPLDVIGKIPDSDGVILLLGERYGSVQASGKSPTHEEFEAAKEAKPIFAFVQSGISAEPRQQAFIDEVGDWSTGTYIANFVDAETLRTAVTTAIHRWEVESASAKVDPEEMASRALIGLPTHDRRNHGASPSVSVSVIGAPRQPILRPSEIEDSRFQRELQKRAIFGEPAIFDTSEGIDASIENHALNLRQSHKSIALSEDGSLVLSIDLPHSDRGFSAIIEEDVAQSISIALMFASELLDSLDKTERLSRIAVAVAIGNFNGGEWRTRAEHEKNPNSMRMISGDSDAQVTLSPPDRSRASFRQNISAMSEDLTVLLRRHFKT